MVEAVLLPRLDIVFLSFLLDEMLYLSEVKDIFHFLVAGTPHMHQ